MKTEPASLPSTSTDPDDAGLGKPSRGKKRQTPLFPAGSERSFFDRLFADRLLPAIILLDDIYDTLEGDRDQEILEKARALQEAPSEAGGQGPAIRNGSKPPSRFAILPTRSFHTVDLDLPTKSLGEARKIAALQLDRLTAVPVEEAIFALAKIAGDGEASQNNSYRAYITRRRLISELRQSGAEFTGAEALVAFNPDQDGGVQGAAFHDDAGRALRAVRRAKLASLILMTGLLATALVWSLGERLDRELAVTQSVTQKAIGVRKEAQETRANALQTLAALQRGPIELSADRALVTLAEITKRQPAKVVIQSLSISEGRVRLVGSALDPNAASAAFSTQPSNAPSPSVPQSPPGPLPVPGSLPSPMQPVGPAAAPALEVQWQAFEVETSAATLARVGMNAQASDFPSSGGVTPAMPKPIGPGPLPGPGVPPQ
jgi:hypothetical protein